MHRSFSTTYTATDIPTQSFHDEAKNGRKKTNNKKKTQTNLKRPVREAPGEETTRNAYKKRQTSPQDLGSFASFLQLLLHQPRHIVLLALLLAGCLLLLLHQPPLLHLCPSALLLPDAAAATSSLPQSVTNIININVISNTNNREIQIQHNVTRKQGRKSFAAAARIRQSPRKLDVA